MLSRKCAVHVYLVISDRKTLLHGLVKQEAEALAATQFAVVLHSGQSRGVQFTIASATPATPATPAAPASVDHV